MPRLGLSHMYRVHAVPNLSRLARAQKEFKEQSKEDDQRNKAAAAEAKRAAEEAMQAATAALVIMCVRSTPSTLPAADSMLAAANTSTGATAP